jgi:hypothetical protein
MLRFKKVIIVGVLLLLVGGIFGINQLIVLRKAHSSFENYYEFRGCVQLIQKADTYGTCKLSSGQIITIVEINNTWYLEGDGPGIW